MNFTGASQSFDRSDHPAFVLHGQRKARQDTLAIDQHRAGAACTLVAILLRAEKLSGLV